MEINHTLHELADAKQSAPLHSLKDAGLQPASWLVSLAKRRLTSNNQREGRPVGLWCDLDYFRQFGPGTYLFFAFNKRIAILFAVLAVLALPALVFNVIGKGLESTGAGSTKILLMRFSIANQPVKTPNLTEDQFELRSAQFKLGVMIPDILYSLAFFVFLLYWEYSSRQTTLELRSAYDLPSYYTVRVKNLPEDTQPSELKQFMNQFGEVMEVSEVRNYEESIRLSKECYENQAAIIQLRESGELEGRRMDRLKERRLCIFNELTEELQTLRPALLECFVMFRFPADRKNCITRFHDENNRGKCCKYHPDPALFYKGKLPLVLPCHIEPSSIIWENMHIGKLSRTLRTLLQMLLVLLITFLAVMLILVLLLLVPPQSTSSINTSSYSYEQVVNENNASVTQSWCLNQKPEAIHVDAALKKLCEVYFSMYFSEIGISFGVSIAVVIVALLLVLVVRSLVRFQRYKTYNEEVSSSIDSLLFANILTTSILTMLLQATFFGFSFRGLLERLLSSGYLKQNADKLRLYDDLMREWYVDIGYRIVLNWLVLTFIPYVFNPFLDLLLEKLSEWRARQQPLQAQMDKMLQKPEFLFEEHYANLLTVVFVPFAFAGPMPLLLPISALALAVRYFYSKYYFLRFCRAPRAFDDSLNNRVMNLLPFAVFIHLLISMYAYGVTDIFPYEMSATQQIMEKANSVAAHTHEVVGRIVKRMATGWPLFVILVIVVVVYIAKLIINHIIRNIWDRHRLRQSKLPTQTLVRNKSLVIGQNHHLLNSYRIERNPDYSEILSFMEAVQTQKRLPDDMVPGNPTHNKRNTQRATIAQRLSQPQLKPLTDTTFSPLPSPTRQNFLIPPRVAVL